MICDDEIILSLAW